jgi:UDP-N-acetylmuramoylalanine--D-glutamate ligase
MQLNDLVNKKIALWGFGREGRSVLQKLLKLNPNINLSVIDRKFDPMLNNYPQLSFIDENNISNLNAFDILIKSPGVSLYNPLIQSYLALGKLVTSATNLWLAENSGQVIGITGSKGKSTTASILNHLFKSAKLDCLLGGNIGLPATELPHGHQHYVLEMSSYQIADLNKEIDCSLLVNLYPQHQIWHKNTEQYYHDKLKLLNLSRTPILNYEFVNLAATQIKIPEKTIFYNNSNGYRFEENGVYYKNQLVVSADKLKVTGAHNLSNLAGALTVFSLYSEVTPQIIEDLQTFNPLPHRLEIIQGKDNLTYINDSISVIPEATLAALKTINHLHTTLLIGGQRIESSWLPVFEFLETNPVHAIISLPDSGAEIIGELIKHFQTKEQDLPCRVLESNSLNTAMEIAKHITPAGGTILLSPGAPSYGRFNNFEERGQLFKQLAINSL